MRLSNKNSGVLVHAGDLFDTIKPKTRAYTTVPETLDWLQTAGIRYCLVKTQYTTRATNS